MVSEPCVLFHHAAAWGDTTHDPISLPEFSQSGTVLKKSYPRTRATKIGELASFALLLTNIRKSCQARTELLVLPSRNLIKHRILSQLVGSEVLTTSLELFPLLKLVSNIGENFSKMMAPYLSTDLQSCF